MRLCYIIRVMKRRKTTSEALIRYIRCIKGVLHERIEADRKPLDRKIKGKHISLEREFKDKTALSGEELGILTISDLIVSVGKDLSIDKKKFPQLTVRTIKFQNVDFMREAGNDKNGAAKNNRFLIDFQEPCKLIFEGCTFNTKVKIESKFMGEAEEETTSACPKVIPQDSTGVELVGCDFYKDAEIYYKRNPKSRAEDSYGKFFAKASTFSQLKINLEELEETETQQDFCLKHLKIKGHQQESYLDECKKKEYRQDFIMIFEGNTVEEKLTVIRKEETGRFEAKLTRGNSIKNIRFRDKYPDVTEWGLKEKIGEMVNTNYASKPSDDQLKTSIYQNKREIMHFREIAKKREDQWQASIIGSHISKCDEQLLQLEKWRVMWQEKLVMWAGRLLSNHGRSWIRPLSWVLAMNLVFALTLHSIFVEPLCLVCSWGGHLNWLCENWKTWLSITVELFNPLATTSTLLKAAGVDYASPGSGFCYSIASAILILSRIVYAICIYEFVRAARRFTYR